MEVDKGKLRWAKDKTLVDTTAGRWKDSGNGGGIVPDNTAGQTAQEETIAALSPASSQQEENTATHYAGDPAIKRSFLKTVKRTFTVHGMVDRLLRKTIRRNTWIYVSVSSPFPLCS